MYVLLQSSKIDHLLLMHMVLFDLDFPNAASSSLTPSCPPFQEHPGLLVQGSVDKMLMQVVVFDLEFGQPAASSSLPPSRPPFRDILGCFAHQAIGRGVTEGGIDLLYCSHQVTL